MPDTWKLEDKTFTKFILNDDIQAKICALSDRINTELAGKKPLFVVVLNGAFIFASDLLKRVTIDCEITFVKLSSYQGTMSTGVVQQIIGLDRDIKGRTIVIIEDIVDTGLTLERFREVLAQMEPAEVKVATCLLKPGNSASASSAVFSFSPLVCSQRFKNSAGNSIVVSSTRK